MRYFKDKEEYIASDDLDEYYFDENTYFKINNEYLNIKDKKKTEKLIDFLKNVKNTDYEYINEDDIEINGKKNKFHIITTYAAFIKKNCKNIDNIPPNYLFTIKIWNFYDFIIFQIYKNYSINKLKNIIDSVLQETSKEIIEDNGKSASENLNAEPRPEKTLDFPINTYLNPENSFIIDIYIYNKKNYIVRTDFIGEFIFENNDFKIEKNIYNIEEKLFIKDSILVDDNIYLLIGKKEDLEKSYDLTTCFLYKFNLTESILTKISEKENLLSMAYNPLFNMIILGYKNNMIGLLDIKNNLITEIPNLINKNIEDDDISLDFLYINWKCHESITISVISTYGNEVYSNIVIFLENKIFLGDSSVALTRIIPFKFYYPFNFIKEKNNNNINYKPFSTKSKYIFYVANSGKYTINLYNDNILSYIGSNIFPSDCYDTDAYTAIHSINIKSNDINTDWFEVVNRQTINYSGLEYKNIVFSLYSNYAIHITFIVLLPEEK